MDKCILLSGNFVFFIFSQDDTKAMRTTDWIRQRSRADKKMFFEKIDNTHVIMQCAAVNIKCSFRRAPPQKNMPSRAIATCQGNSPMTVSLPETMRRLACRDWSGMVCSACKWRFVAPEKYEIHKPIDKRLDITHWNELSTNVIRSVLGVNKQILTSFLI